MDLFLVIKKGNKEPLHTIRATDIDAATDEAIKLLALTTENHDLDCISDHTTIITTHDDVEFAVVEEGYEGYDIWD
jgi:hypothetical protein